MRLSRLVVLGVFLGAAACSTSEEGPPPPLRTSPAEERQKPAQTNNAQLKDTASAPVPGISDPGTPAPTSGCGKSGLTKGAGQAKTIDVWGETRSYTLSVPQSYGELPKSWRLVFAFHGGGGTGSQLRSWYDTDQRYAETNAIVVYPDAKDGNWDLDSPSATNHDIAFFDALLDSIGSQACIDATRVFAVGFSNGAYFTNQLGCRRGTVFRAIAPHAGGGPYGSGSDYNGDGNLVCAGAPPAVKIFHAWDDDVVPMSHAESSIAHWKWANGCQDSTHDTAPSPCVGYDGCGKAVEVCRYSGVGHSVWSEGAKATWDFFSGF